MTMWMRRQGLRCRIAIRGLETEMATQCECGCGLLIPAPKYPSEQRRYLKGHNNVQERDAKGILDATECPCGCGEKARQIPLTQNKVAIVSLEDYDRLSIFLWFAIK